MRSKQAYRTRWPHSHSTPIVPAASLRALVGVHHRSPWANWASHTCTHVTNKRHALINDTNAIVYKTRVFTWQLATSSSATQLHLSVLSWVTKLSIANFIKKEYGSAANSLIIPKESLQCSDCLTFSTLTPSNPTFIANYSPTHDKLPLKKNASSYQETTKRKTQLSDLWMTHRNSATIADTDTVWTTRAYLQAQILINHYVLHLHVSMTDTVGMGMIEGTEELKCQLWASFGRKRAVRVNVGGSIVRVVVHNDAPSEN